MDSYNKPTSNSNSNSYHHKASSPTDLLSSAKLLADAAMSRGKGKKVDMSGAAGAADEILHAVSQYGHLEDKSFGKYIETAEGYLHKYAAPQTDQSKPSKFNQSQEEYSDEEEEERPRPKPASHGKVKKQQYEEEEYEEERPRPKPASQGKVKQQQYEDEEYEEERPVYHGKVKKQQEYEDEEEETGGGIGNYVKMAQGFMKSQNGGHSGNSASEGGIGDYMKLAQGFLGKR